MLAKPINWVLCIAKNINVMAARIQLTRERQHVLTQATKLRLRDVFADQENSQSPPCQISLLTPRAHRRHEDGSEKLCSQRGDSCGREGGASAGIGGRDRYDHAESLHDPIGSNPQSRRTRVVTYCR